MWIKSYSLRDSQNKIATYVHFANPETHDYITFNGKVILYKLVLGACVRVPKKSKGNFFYYSLILFILIKTLYTRSIENQKEEHLLNTFPHE